MKLSSGACVKRAVRAGLAVCAGVVLAGCGHVGGSGAAAPLDSAGATVARTDPQTGDPLLPDPRLTPGDADSRFTLQDVCTPGFTKTVRDVPESVKRQVYAEYGIASHRPHQYEVDHLISLELGGSNSIKNLWPQSYETQPWNAHVKDQLENKLHDMVCAGQVSMATAQHDIASDWIAAYKKYFQTDVPLSDAGGHRTSGGGRHHRRLEAAPPVTQAAPSGSDVWVNTRSGKYFHAGSPYYGHTKEGDYMTEQQAQQQGFVPARGQ